MDDSDQVRGYVLTLRNRWKGPIGRQWRQRIISELATRKAWSGNPDLRGIDLARADLSNCALEGVLLDFSMLDEANLSGACLQRASLLGASLRHSNLINADLGFADLRGCDLREARTQGLDSDGALTGPIPVQSYSAELRRLAEQSQRSKFPPIFDEVKKTL